MNRRVAVLTAAAGMAAVLASCSSPLGYRDYRPPATLVSPSASSTVAHASLSRQVAGYFGVYDKDTPGSYHRIIQFTRAVGVKPNIVLYYAGLNGGLQMGLANLAYAHGATLAIYLDPVGKGNKYIPLSKIVNGNYDRHLKYIADTVRTFGHSVIISFGHEMNGDWYPWGYTKASPALWVKAWRHIVNLFRQEGADNVTWMWTINALSPGEAPIRHWWPGASYVDWVGFDAYYFHADQTFTSTFGPTIAAIHKITKKPILIGETAVGPVAGQAAKIPGLLAGIHRAHLLGFIWFDISQSGSIFHQDWRLESNPEAVTAFRQAAKRYLNNLTRPNG